MSRPGDVFFIDGERYYLWETRRVQPGETRDPHRLNSGEAALLIEVELDHPAISNMVYFDLVLVNERLGYVNRKCLLKAVATT